ncbi:MAG: peroxide stress protein YaaA [Thermoleophilia bacterium]
MLAVVSPAKSLDWDRPLSTRRHSEPQLLDDARELARVMAGQTPARIAALMKLSPKLADLNVERFRSWDPDPAPPGARPAVLAFDGDTYRGMRAPETFSERDFTHAQKTLRILSGLYGVLRPLDLIQPYRLEMGTRLATGRGEDLYDFWGDRITAAVREAVHASPGAAVLVNLASQEYFRSVRTDALDARVITPVFLDGGPGVEPRVVSFHAKRARGAMAGWIVRERVSAIRALTEFTDLGYRHDPDRSEPGRPAFVRMAPA